MRKPDYGINYAFQFQQMVKKLTFILRVGKFCDPILTIILAHLKTKTGDTKPWEKFSQT